MYKLIIASVLLLSSCQSDPPVKPGNATTGNTNTPASNAPATVPEPLFVQEGVLEFHSPGNAPASLLRLNIEIAQDQLERTEGLMWRKKMGENEGMLFVFDFEEPQSFWMRNTYIPLDIIYINEKFEVVTVLRDVPVLNDVSRPSVKPAKYVVEVNAGIAEKHAIVPGCRIAWTDFITGQTHGNFPVQTF